ncbi:MAG: hypothetical protein CMN30_22630 [Sandaracinus sp.]|nr:hypothetical protein [Sandaracinus sp.]|tara:strand:+ start:823 stop:1377 length:555 start_codon:yes stop_codon:yes gene_type:complete
MSESDVAKYLDTFPNWLRNLGHDAEELSELLTESTVAQDAREAVAGGLNYLFKSLDLIPDGIDDIGYLDDAFVLRVAADLASNEDTGEANADMLKTINRLSEESEMIKEFLGKDYGRLEAYVRGLRNGAARGRSVDDILRDEDVRKALLSDVVGFAKSYESPSFSREEKNLIKLKAFFDAKLPQ